MCRQSCAADYSWLIERFSLYTCCFVMSLFAACMWYVTITNSSLRTKAYIDNCGYVLFLYLSRAQLQQQQQQPTVIKTIVRRYIFEHLLASVAPNEGFSNLLIQKQYTRQVLFVLFRSWVVKIKILTSNVYIIIIIYALQYVHLVSNANIDFLNSNNSVEIIIKYILVSFFFLFCHTKLIDV